MFLMLLGERDSKRGERHETTICYNPILYHSLRQQYVINTIPFEIAQ